MAKKKAKKRVGLRKSNPAFAAPMHVSDELAAIIGTDYETRPQVVKKTWEYIKDMGLQEGRNIILDENLQALVRGRKKMITMFELASIISKHLKADV